MAKTFKSSAEMTADDVKEVFSGLVSRSRISPNSDKPICVKATYSSGGFVMSSKRCGPENTIKELVEFAIEKRAKGEDVELFCSAAGKQDCAAFNEMYKSSLVDYSNPNPEL